MTFLQFVAALGTGIVVILAPTRIVEQRLQHLVCRDEPQVPTALEVPHAPHARAASLQDAMADLLTTESD